MSAANFGGWLVLGVLVGAILLNFIYTMMGSFILSAFRINDIRVVYGIAQVCCVSAGAFLGWRAYRTRQLPNGFLLGLAVGLLGGATICEAIFNGLRAR